MQKLSVQAYFFTVPAVVRSVTNENCLYRITEIAHVEILCLINVAEYDRLEKAVS